MNIRDYQIDNILEQFGKRYLKKRGIRREGAGKRSFPAQVSADGKRRDISNKVAADILERVTHLDQEEDARPTTGRRDRKKNAPPPRGVPGKANSSRESEFSFNVIGKDNRKKTKTIPVGAPDAFLERLERLGRETAEKAN